MKTDRNYKKGTMEKMTRNAIVLMMIALAALTGWGAGQTEPRKTRQASKRTPAGQTAKTSFGQAKNVAPKISIPNMPELKFSNKLADIPLQQHPNSGKVGIAFTLTEDIAAIANEKASIATLKVTATDRVSGKTYSATSLSGDTFPTKGAHMLVWDMDEDGVALESTNVVIAVSFDIKPALYCVVDLAANGRNSPVKYLDAPPSGGFNTSEYKTDRLVLRRIEPGSFKMGGLHDVTLTKLFFCGIFEVTRKQYAAVMGADYHDRYMDMEPVDWVSYNTIRGPSKGAKWPASSDVDASSFIGKLRARTRLNFDLPTEAQWEYACRAGTTTQYYWGNEINDDYAWHSGNSNYHTHVVGMKMPNAWGLYDMSGNVWELCLDIWKDCPPASGIDPVGPSSKEPFTKMLRVMRGGASNNAPTSSYSSCRWKILPLKRTAFIGFRVVITLPE